MSFEQRVAYQRAIEQVYWRHRIWPNENKSPKPSLDRVMMDSVIRAKVQDYVKKSNALAEYWHRPITPHQLQAEIDRMVKNSRQPAMLRELFVALGNDPRIIAECLARPVLAERLIHNWYSNDQRFHGALRQRIESELRGTTVQSIRALSGHYSEMETAKETSVGPSAKDRILNVSEKEWNQRVSNLKEFFGNSDLPVGKLSELQEDADRFFVVTVLEKQNNKMKTATVEWSKKSFADWWTVERDRIQSNIVETPHLYTPPQLPSSSPCTNDTWTAIASSDLPDGRYGHTAVWTGSEMIVWGGYNGVSLSSGGRYDPSTDTWSATSNTNAPTARNSHTAVWTGQEMIVWGGFENNVVVSSGAKYDPVADTWTATSVSNVAEARARHTAVWTGNEMIVWGGSSADDLLSSGGRYNPTTNTWTATSNTDAPVKRYLHTAIWTGMEMIVWGGFGAPAQTQSSGGRYIPAADAWIPITSTGAPSARLDHTAIWTGSEMIIWGGAGHNTGGRYNPSTDGWNATSTSNAPTERGGHVAVWTGTLMIVWGGYDSNSITMNTGGIYDPIADSWGVTSNNNAPSARSEHEAVWTGSEMIIVGGASGVYPSSGGRYDPTNNSWIAIRINDVPEARTNHTAVWTGSEMIVWGGTSEIDELSSGGRYDPAIDNWTPTNLSNAPEARLYHTAVFTGIEMIIWGGLGNTLSLSSGGRYNPSTDSWTATSSNNVPEARFRHTAVWTDTEMIIWSGQSNFGYLTSGGRYDPSNDSWTATSTTNVPQARQYHTAVWTSTEMMIWGGSDDTSLFSTGGRYDPSTDSWTATSTTNAPQARASHTAVLSGNRVTIWGGSDGNTSLFTGGRYDPSNDTWTPTNSSTAPSARSNHTAVFTGTEMVVWGGFPETTSGGRYDPFADSWFITNTDNAPQARFDHTAIWSGTEMIVWGGATLASGPLDSGGRYCAAFLPAVYIASAAITEGDSGTIDLGFDVNTFVPSTQDITINYQTADDTAKTSDGDYQSATSSITIPAGQTQGTIIIKINGDTKYENDETFFVNITSVTNATIGDGEAEGTIENDDSPPSLTIDDVTQLEPEPFPGLIGAVFTVTLSAVSGVETKVDFSTQQNTATADVDFQTTSGTLTIPAGVASGTIFTTILHDGLAEGDETYFVNLSNPVNATIADAQGECTITNREPRIYAGPFSADEGNSGTTSFTFTIHSSFAYSVDTSFNYTTQNGTAFAPGDYTTTSGTLTIPAFSLSNTITVPVIGDTNFEADETFQVKLSNCTNCSFQNDTGLSIIFNDDPAPPALSINDISMSEGNSGWIDFVFTVSLNQQAGGNVRVQFRTANGTANTGDYKSKPVNLTIMAGSLSTTVTVKVKGDTITEANETFFGQLSNAVGAIIADGSGTATILNDD